MEIPKRFRTRFPEDIDGLLKYFDLPMAKTAARSLGLRKMSVTALKLNPLETGDRKHELKRLFRDNAGAPHAGIQLDMSQGALAHLRRCPINNAGFFIGRHGERNIGTYQFR